MLNIRKLSCGYGNKLILKEVSFVANQGEIVCILGPNGSGKTTLIKTIVGLIDPIKGDILVNGVNTRGWAWNQRAKIMSYIPQTFSSTFQYKAIDIVLMGRTAYIGISSFPSKEDIAIAEQSMEKLHIAHLKDKIYSHMSGGERQLVKIAQALTQKSEIIVMDEPTNNLDFGNQSMMLSNLSRCAEMGITILMATHFPEQAMHYGSKALLLNHGKVIEVNQPSENLTEERLQELYKIKVKLVEIDIKGKKRKVCLI